MSDPSVRVVQKNETLWERVVEGFKKIRHDKDGLNPEDFTRNSGACENRMGEIKKQCSRWIAIRATCLGTYKSEWSSEDMEGLCQDQYTKRWKKAFQMMKCLTVLKDHPKWHDYLAKSENSSQSKRGPRTKQVALSVEPDVSQSLSTVPNVTMETDSPHTPSTITVSSNSRLRENGIHSCTPNLDGPASIDLDRPSGMKKEKINNQRQRWIQKHAESGALARQSFTASLANIEASSLANWEKQLEETRRKNMIDEEILLDMKHHQIEMAEDTKRKSDLEHAIKVWNDRTIIVKNRVDMSKQIIEAYKMLDDSGDPRSLITIGQKKEYEYQMKTIQELEEQYAGLGEMLSVSKLVSPVKAQKKDHVESTCVSQRRLFKESP